MKVLPELYDLIDELFPDAYNKGYGGKLGRMDAVKWKQGEIVGKTKFIVAKSNTDAQTDS